MKKFLISLLALVSTLVSAQSIEVGKDRQNTIINVTHQIETDDGYGQV